MFGPDCAVPVGGQGAFTVTVRVTVVETHLDDVVHASLLKRLGRPEDVDCVRIVVGFVATGVSGCSNDRRRL